MSACPTCAEENPERARFCLACGTQLLRPGEPEETRRLVTVVFVDVVDSTGLGERLDPEALRRTMSDFFELARGVLERHGGTVEKYIGDAVMCVFGVPVLHEDDALRAARAALQLRAAAASDPRTRELRLRIGINTGEVVTDAGTGRQRLVTGDAVNTAARLQQVAPPGDVLLGPTTAALLRNAASTEPVELDLRGKSGRTPAHRLLAIDPAADIHARDLGSPIVGRERELARLLRAYEDAVQDRRCTLFTLLGPAGVGKSRLVHELVARVRGEALVLRGRCLPYGDGITLWPIAEVLRAAAGVEDEDDAPVVAAKLRALVAPSLEADRIAAAIAGALGLTTDAIDGDEIFWAVRRTVEIVAGARPLVIVIDDLQWAEPTLLELVDHLSDWTRNASVLLVVIARPELLDIRPSWGGGKLDSTTVMLEPLPDSGARAIARRLLADADQPTLDRVVAVAEGNPLFVEQLAALVRETGGDVDVPPSIHALLAARLDALPPAERGLAGRASVVGRVFERTAVVELSPETDRGRVPAAIRSLVRRELVRPDPESPEDAFRFRHLLIRDAAYDSLPKRERAALHERFASWLERMAADRILEYEEIIGYHLEQAARYSAEVSDDSAEVERLRTRAARRLARAGGRAFQRSDTHAAIGLWTRARSLADADDPVVAAELPWLGVALFGIGRVAEAREILAGVVSVAASIGDRPLEMRARVLGVEFEAEDESRAGDELRALLPVLDEVGDDVALARAWGVLHEDHLNRGQCELALGAAERALLHARRAGDRRETARQLHGVVTALVMGPMPASKALSRAEAVVREAAGHMAFAALCEATLAALVAMLGDAERARALVGSAHGAVDEMRLPVLRALVCAFEGWVEWILGSADRQERAARRGLEASHESGRETWVANAEIFLAQACWESGNREEARVHIERSAHRGVRLGSLDGTRQARMLALVAAADGRHADARRSVAAARELLAGTDALPDLADLEMDAARVALMAGDAAAAADHGAAALAHVRAKGDVSSEKRIVGLLEQVR